MAFQKGHQVNLGRRKGRGDVGRAVSEEAKGSLRRCKGFQVLERIASGDIRDQLEKSKKSGEMIIGTTLNKDRIRAIEVLASYAHGKPTPIMTTPDGSAIVPIAIYKLPDNGRDRKPEEQK